jgi:hypothetical protein
MSVTEKFTSVSIAPITTELGLGGWLGTYQPSGPTAATIGYIVIKNREDDLPVAIIRGLELGDVMIAAEALAKVLMLPFDRPDWLKKRKPQIVAVQVMPVFDNPESSGPTQEPTRWSVYFQLDSGEYTWLADTGTEERSEIVGNAYAITFGVPFVHQVWKQNL